MVEINHTTVLVVDNILQRLGTSTEPWFAYTVAQNRSALAPIMEALTAAQRRDPAYDEYEQKRKVLLESHARKDSNGKAMTTKAEYPDGTVRETYDIEDQGAFEAAVLELTASEKFADIISKEDLRRVKLQELLAAKVQVNLIPIKMSDAPKGVVTGNDMAALSTAGILDWDIKRITEV